MARQTWPHGSAGVSWPYWSFQGAVAVNNSSSTPDVGITTKPREREETHTHRQPPYNVILENDDDHSFEFVMEVLRKVLACTEQRAFQLTHEAHTNGRAIIWTGAREVAEFKVEQVQTFQEIKGSTKLGSLGCYLEPAPG
jgi:ATP-dependent Clp protease adaptor protein ClpS